MTGAGIADPAVQPAWPERSACSVGSQLRRSPQHRWRRSSATLHRASQTAARSDVPYAPVGSIPETSSALRRWLPVQSDKGPLQQRTSPPQFVSAASAIPPCPSGLRRELEISAWQYPVQPLLSSSGNTSGTELTMTPDGSIPLGHLDAPGKILIGLYEFGENFLLCGVVGTELGFAPSASKSNLITNCDLG